MSRWQSESRLLTRYLGSGMLNTVAGFAVIFTLMAMGASPLVANICGYAVGFILGFVVSKKFVFHSNGHLVHESVRYLTAFTLCFLFNIWVLQLALHQLHSPALFAQLLAACAYTSSMYLLTRYFVFQGKKMTRPVILLWLAALSFLPTLVFYVVGEEGIYTISTLEMWHSQNWFIQTLYGHNLQRPPLMNWLALPLIALLGESQVLLAIRLLSVAATLGMAAWLYWLSRKLWGDKSFALFAALSYLSLADLLLYRGWLAYTDPLFGFFIFGAIATLWVSCVERHKGWLALSVLLIGCALLTKVFTAYLFYASAILVLLWQRPYRAFLLTPTALLILATALIAPYFWFASLPQASGQSSSMMGEIARKLSAQDAWAYLQRLLIYPLETLIWLAPAPLLAIYLLARKRLVQAESLPVHFQVALWITMLSVLPYWLAPQGGIRYLVPIYPLITLLSARLIWRSGTTGQQLALRWFAGIIAFKFMFALALFPYYQTHYRGENYVIAAHELTQLTQQFPVYINDTRSISLNIIGQMDIDRLPRPPLVIPPAQWDNGFLLIAEPQHLGSQLVKKITVAKDDIYLFCRGAACLNASPH